ncbi:MAG: precorrin-6A reductase [Acidaminococcaceae bacterium]
MNKKPLIWLIAGTSEGRKLIKALASSNVEIIASVATEYGASIIEPQNNLKVIAERMNVEKMIAFIANNRPDCVVDATHPYAVIVTKTIKAACAAANCQYLRFLRQESSTDDCVQVDSYQEAVEFLNHVEGNIFLTTGSNNLEFFTKLTDYQDRVTVRILPMQNSLEKALQLGYKPTNIICMQGPFTEELNIAMFKDSKAKYIVTKDSGNAGGFEEKKKAAMTAGASLIVIKREPEYEGADFADILAKIEEMCTKKHGAGEAVDC